MKEELLIVGVGGFGRVTLEHVIKEYDCLLVDDGKFGSNVTIKKELITT